MYTSQAQIPSVSLQVVIISTPATYADPITPIVISIPSPSTSHAQIPSISIPQVNMPIPTTTIYQPVSLIIVSEMSTPTVEEIAYFGDDAVVALREYFWRKTKKHV